MKLRALATSRRIWRRLAAAGIVAFALSAVSAHARNGSETLNHYGLVTLTDSATGNRLAARFKAKGQPVFLLHDVNAGLSRNDIMRFSDRAVLVDAEVWATLRAEGALDKIQSSPLIRVQGRATSASWTQRATLVSGDRQRKAFKLGAEILRVLEENFGGAPLENQMTLVFDQGRLTLLAAPGLMDQLSFFAVRRVMPEGAPRFVSVPPDSNQFVNQPFDFQLWAVDPNNPSGSLNYSITGALPPGLTWDEERHALRGTPLAAGSWKLLASAQNTEGRRDTLRFALRFRVNEAPMTPTPPRTTVGVDQDWIYAPKLVDGDHPGYDLRILPATMPQGMAFRPDLGTFQWRPDSSLIGTRHTLAFSIEDALGAKRSYAYDLRVAKDEGVLLSEGVKIDLPWDTLMRGRAYTWKTGAIRAAWAGQNIRLNGITGPDSTRFENDTLFIRPMKAGIHQLDFDFTVQGVPAVQSILLPVQEDLPPVFLTELSQWKARVGDPPRKYMPIAVDPEGERVSMTAEFPKGSPLSWDGKRLVMNPKKPGVYPARFVARDAGGKATEQWVAFDTDKEMAGAAWMLEGHTQGAYTAWTITRDFGTGRFGFYSPNFTDIYKPMSSYWSDRESPFMFVGGNLMGRQAEARGRVLWTDLGLSLGVRKVNFFTSGLYLRMNGEWSFPNSPLSMVEMELRAHVHQAIAATDSGTLSRLFKDTTDIISRDSISADGVLSKVLQDGYRNDNMRIFFRLEALGPIAWGFYAGPALWREDKPMAQSHLQWMGGAVRYRFSRFSDVLQATFRMGWTPGGGDPEQAGWGWYATIRTAIGSPL
jgi:hypothetical protein